MAEEVNEENGTKSKRRASLDPARLAESVADLPMRDLRAFAAALKTTDAEAARVVGEALGNVSR